MSEPDKLNAMGVAGPHSPPPGPQGRGLRRHPHDFPEKFAERRRLWLIADRERFAPNGEADSARSRN